MVPLSLGSSCLAYNTHPIPQLQVPQSGSASGSELAGLVNAAVSRCHFQDGPAALHFFRHHARLIVQEYREEASQVRQGLAWA